MTTVQAWQHIYSNVEKEQSPQRRGGFQTLFYTRSGLTEAEVEEMEGRLLYFPSGVEPVKRLFFTLSTGKGVVAQIAALAEADRAGRKGRYLAHGLVFAPQALAQFEADPFRVFRSFSFITTVAGALAQGDFRTGDIPAVTLEVSPDLAGDVEVARHWSPPELKKLALLALRADQQARAREAIVFAGDAPQIEGALEASFLAVPASLRLRCLFDTYFYRCNLVATYYWAIGLPEPPVSIKFALVDGRSRRVQGTVPAEPETAYERWVLAATQAGQLDEIARQRESAFAVAEWLDGREGGESDARRLEAAPPDLIAAVLRADPSALRALLSRRIGELLPPPLADRAAGAIGRRMEEMALYRQLRRGFELPQLMDRLYESYAASQFEKPPRGEVKALGDLLKKTDHSLLRLAWAYWSDARKQLPRELERAGEAEYRCFASSALRLGLVEPFDLLVPGRGDAFLDLYLPGGIHDIIGLVEALIKAKEMACLARLIDAVPKLAGGDLDRLARIVDKQRDVPGPFRRAVEEASAASPPEGGIKRILRAVLRR
jgi:hypothetical protein